MTTKHVCLGWNPGGVRSDMHIEEENGIAHFTHTQPGAVIEKILDANHDDRTAGHNPVAQGRLAARVPQTLYLTWYREWEKVKNQTSVEAFMVRKLNDYNHSKLLIHATSGGLTAKE